MLLARLIDEKVLRDPRSSGDLKTNGDGLVHGADGRAYSMHSGALDLYDDYHALDELQPPPRDFVKAIAEALGIPTTDGYLKAVSQAVMDTQLVPRFSRHLGAEVRELASRMHIEEPSDWPPALTGQQEELRSSSFNEDVQVKLLSESVHWPGHARAGREFTISVRIRNDGASTIGSHGDHPVHLSYHWVDDKGDMPIEEGHRSPLPRDVEPGDELTVILGLQAPRRRGRYTLQLRVVQELVHWHETTGVDLPAEVTRSRGRHSLDRLTRVDVPFNYADEIKSVRAMLEECFPPPEGNERHRLLEVGSGVYPQIIELSADRADVIAADISFAMSQLGSLIFTHLNQTANADHFLFLASDAMQLPIANESMDGIVICAALHHFPDPVALLCRLRSLLKPTGLLIAVREPCSPNPFGEDYLKDIRLGINEQQWSPGEYASIFSKAGLEVVRGVTRSRCSLNVVLRPIQQPVEHV